MNISITNGNLVKSNLYSGLVDFYGGSPDTFKAMLMRENFSFSSSVHKYKKNLNKTTTTSSMFAVAATYTLGGYSGSFVTDGLVAGNYITIAGADNTNPYTYKLSTVAATSLRMTNVDDSVWVACGTETTDEKSLTVTSRDEVRAINFKSGGDGEITVTTNATNSSFIISSGRWDTTYKFRIGEVFHTGGSNNDGTGDNLGPYIVTDFLSNGQEMVVATIGGSTAIVTDASAQAYTFTNGTAWNTAYAETTVTFTVDGNTLTLNPFNFTDFGVARWGSPGFIIYDEDHADDIVIAYCRFSDWTLSF